MKRSVCVDVGGTFTDAALQNEDGSIHIYKSPSTPDNWSEGILNVLKIAAEKNNCTLAELLASVSKINGGTFTHGSTIATNAILERKCGKVGIICTDGFRETLLVRDGDASTKPPYEFDMDFPKPFVPRYLTLGVKERVDYEGNVVVPLDEVELMEKVEELVKYQVESIAICFLWSINNPSHELRAKELILEKYPQMNVAVSCEVNPCTREYRRWVSAAMNASLQNLVSKYTDKLNGELNKEGFVGEVGMLNAYGGVMSCQSIVKKPLFSVDSGPAIAPVSGRKYVKDELGKDDVLVVDMGGTTFDVSCVVDGTISVSSESRIGSEVPGIPRVDIFSVGAGGGSIAWVDSGDMIRVGPQSAGSQPGPVCYQRGGIEPTVTDANVVLGYLDPHNFNDGRMELDKESAEKVIKEQLADKLNMEVQEAAFSIWNTVNANMIAAIKDITIWKGIDPREYVMVAGGGACGVHALAIAEGLDIQELLIPRVAGGLSAVGGIFSDTVSIFSSGKYAVTNKLNIQESNGVIQELYNQALKFFEENGIDEERQQIELYIQARYPKQIWEIPVDITKCVNEKMELSQSSVKKIEMAFHEEHEKVFAVKDDSYIEIIEWRLKATGKRLNQENVAKECKESNVIPEEAYKGKRQVYFHIYQKMVETTVYSGEKLLPGNQIIGPAIIEEPTTSILVEPGFTMEVTKGNNYYVDLRKKVEC